MKKLKEFLKNIFNKGFFHLMSANLIIGFMGFGSQLLVAKFLTAEELGEIKTMQSFIGGFLILSGFGFNAAVLKLCSEKREDKEKKNIFFNNLRYTSITIIFSMFVIYFLSINGLFSPDANINKLMLYYMLVLPFLTTNVLVMSYLQALKKIKLMSKIQVGVKLFSIIFLILFTKFYGIKGFIASIIIGAAVATVPLLYIVREELTRWTSFVNYFKKSINYGFWSTVGNFLSLIGKYMDIFMLNYLISDRKTFGYYSLATIFIIGLNYIMVTVQAISTPYFSEKSDNRKEFMRVLYKYQKLLIFFSFVALIVSNLLVPVLIKSFYGSKYTPVIPFFHILTIKFFFEAFHALLPQAIFGLGFIKVNSLIGPTVLVISMIANYFMIKRYGIYGAAWAQVITYFFTTIVIYVMMKWCIDKKWGIVNS